MARHDEAAKRRDTRHRDDETRLALHKRHEPVRVLLSARARESGFPRFAAELRVSRRARSRIRSRLKFTPQREGHRHAIDARKTESARDELSLGFVR